MTDERIIRDKPEDDISLGSITVQEIRNALGLTGQAASQKELNSLIARVVALEGNTNTVNAETNVSSTSASIGFITDTGYYCENNTGKVIIRPFSLEVGSKEYRLSSILTVDMGVRFGTSFDPNTWYFFFAGVPANGSTYVTADFYVYKTEPTDYMSALYHASNRSLRCLGFFITDGSGTISNFHAEGGHWRWLDGPETIYSVLNPGGSWVLTKCETPFANRKSLVYLRGYSGDSGSWRSQTYIKNGDSSEPIDDKFTVSGGFVSLVVGTVGSLGYFGGYGIYVTNEAGKVYVGSHAGDYSVKVYQDGLVIPGGLLGA